MSAYHSRPNIVPFLILAMFVGCSVVYYLLTLPNERFVPWAVVQPLIGKGNSTWELVASGLSIAIVCGLAFVVSHHHQDNHVHGDARYATQADMRRAGLFKRAGVVLGKTNAPIGARPVIFDDNESVLAVMPTGIGKTSGVVIPTILSYQGSLIITDLKGEIGKATAGFRSQFSEVYTFRLNGEPTHKINLLDFIRWETDYQTRDIDRLASAYFPPVKNYFEDAPRDLLSALIEVAHRLPDLPTTMHTIWLLINPTVFYKDANGNFKDSSEHQFSGKAIAHYFKQLTTDAPDLSDGTTRILNRFADMPYKQLQGVVDGLNKALTPFRDPLVDRATCATDMDLKAIRKKRMTLYFELSANEYKTYAPLIRVYYEFIQDLLVEHLPTEDEPLNLLFIYDEFANLGEMHEFSRFISLCRQYQIQVMAIVQGLSQLESVYKEQKNTLVSAFKKQLFSVVNDLETGDYISKRSGTRTSGTESYSGDRFNEGSRARVSSGQVSEQLVKHFETFLFAKGKALLFAESMRPAAITILQSWKDPVFKKRLALSKNIGYEVKPTSVADYSAITNYPCVLSEEPTSENIPEKFDLSEYEHLFEDEDASAPITD